MTATLDPIPSGTPAALAVARAIEIIDPGPLATVQDLGRPGYAALGVGRSGAADRRSIRLANRLVGNPEHAAALEITYGGLTLRADRTVLVCLAGAPCPATAGGRAVDMHSPVHLRRGERLEVGRPTRGLRTYLAVRGGIDVMPVLGSRATDTLAGLGPAPIRAGTRLPVGAASLPHPGVDHAPQAGLPDEPSLRLLPGPRADWFAADAPAVLCSAPYEVSADSNRVGLRLAGPRLRRRRTAELPPEGLVPGAIQVPPGGEPIVFLADHPVTGGYPVIAVVHPGDLPLAAQARPGQRIRFRTLH